MPRLREAMARASTRCTGVETTAAQVIVTPGGQLALYAAVQGTLDTGDHAIVVAPYYATYPGTFRAAEADFTVVEAEATDGFQPRAEAIEAALKPNTRAILINTPNNPTGAIYSRESLEAIARLCVEHDLWLLSDEVYWTLGGGHHVSPRALPGMAERTLVINSMSKSHGMTGWRIGWLTGPESMITLLISLNLVTTYGLTDFVQQAAAEALENDYGVKQIADTYNGRRKVFLDAVRGLNDITVRGSEGGMYVMLDISADRAGRREIRLGLPRRREGRRHAGIELRRRGGRAYPHQPLPAGRRAARGRQRACAASLPPIAARRPDAWPPFPPRPAPSSSAAAFPAARSPIISPSSAGPMSCCSSASSSPRARPGTRPG